MLGETFWPLRKKWEPLQVPFGLTRPCGLTRPWPHKAKNPPGLEPDPNLVHLFPKEDYPIKGAQPLGGDSPADNRMGGSGGHKLRAGLVNTCSSCMLMPSMVHAAAHTKFPRTYFSSTHQVLGETFWPLRKKWEPLQVPFGLTRPCGLTRPWPHKAKNPPGLEPDPNLVHLFPKEDYPITRP